jgi:hypothetical protein
MNKILLSNLFIINEFRSRLKACILILLSFALTSCINEVTYKEEKKDFYYSINLPIGTEVVYDTDDSVYFKIAEFNIDLKLYFFHKSDFSSYGIQLTAEEYLFSKMSEKRIDFNPIQFEDYRAGVYSGKKWIVSCEESKDCNLRYGALETSKFFVLLESNMGKTQKPKLQNQVVEEFFFSYRELLVAAEESFKQ